MQKIKELFKDTSKVQRIALWSFRILLIAGLVYLIFFNQTTVITEFNSNGVDSTNVLDYKIGENEKIDSLLKAKRHETIYVYDSVSNDSLRKIILRADR